jgi:four helix bundle suffix protein
MQLFDKSGGYRKLDSFTLATVIQLGTIRFCERFLDRRNDPCGRTYDQMTQAARSGRQNIIEGSERAATSKETEMKLTDVARASLGELRGDYEIWVLKEREAPWDPHSDEAQGVYGVRLDPVGEHAENAHGSGLYLLDQEKKFSRWIDSDDSLVAANALLILIQRAIRMLNKQREAQGRRFLESGGFRERLTAARLEERDRQESEETPACPECGKPMRKRTAKAGKNAGQEFWGCTAYPECTGTREAGEAAGG